MLLSPSSSCIQYSWMNGSLCFTQRIQNVSVHPHCPYKVFSFVWTLDQKDFAALMVSYLWSRMVGVMLALSIRNLVCRTVTCVDSLTPLSGECLAISSASLLGAHGIPWLH